MGSDPFGLKIFKTRLMFLVSETSMRSFESTATRAGDTSL